MTAALVTMTQITKKFPGVTANDRVDFQALPGEIHALLGENGAGKSTLMNILTGLYRPDGGEIHIRGRRVPLSSPREAMEAGVGMVHQHFRLVHPFSVAENVILGSRREGFWLRRKAAEQKIAGLSRSYGLEVDPRAKVWQLSVGEQQRVEIIKMLYRGADILILDEPTAVLTPQEVKDLFATLRRMAEGGKAVIFITHKLQEVMEYADRITVLRGGRTVATVKKGENGIRELARLMVGRDLAADQARTPVNPGPPILRLEGVSAVNDKGLPALVEVTLSVREGEILGIAGVAGNGQRELAEVVTGLRPTTAGKVFIGDADLTNRSPRRMIEAGVGHIPEDRMGTGLVPNLGAVDNTMLKAYRDRSACPGWLLNQKDLRERTRQLVGGFEVKTAGLDTPVKLMSGGNLQRLLLAREISADPRLIVAVYPIRGLDVGATEVVHSLLLSQREKGKGVLLISEDLEEIFKLADRVAVLYEGRVMGVLPVEATGVEEVGLMMAGAKRIEVAAG